LSGRKGGGPRTRRAIAIGGGSAVAVFGVVLATASGANSIGGNFEIDTTSQTNPAGANLVVNGTAPNIDWLNTAGTAMRSGVMIKNDTASGGGDNSFGNGTKEDDAVPSVTSGGIPPNKSDLKSFGIFKEQGATGTFLDLFWTRVQDPSGTTNMDFEFNKLACDPSLPAGGGGCSANGITPKRSAGDLLIEYHLDNGGAVATLSLKEWTGTAWGTTQPLASKSIGAINTAAILAANSGGLGPLSPRTFGEASIDLSAALGTDECVTFGSAYLKSRSADSFTSAVKDFIAPQRVTVTNCGEVVINKTDDADVALDDAEFELYLDTDPNDGDTGHAADDVATGLTCITDGGTCSITEVPFGQYWVVEIDTPDGYDTAADQATTISASSLSVSLDFVDVRQDGSIHITKTDDDGNLLNGITFTASQGGLAAGSCTTGDGQNPDGECTISDLNVGTYVVSESNLPLDYSADPDFPVTVSVTSNHTTEVAVENPRKHKIITIVCHEGNLELMSVTATLGATNVSTMGTVPAALAAKTVTQQDLCGITAGTFDHLTHGTKAVSVAIGAHP
jgi:hypothetical protein